MHAYLMISRKPGYYTLLDEINKLKVDYELDIYGPFEVYGVCDAILEARQAKDTFDLYRKFIVPIISLKSVGSCATYVVVREMPEKPPQNEGPQAYVAIDAAHPHEVAEQAQEEIYRIDQVQRSDIVLGPYDIIARVVCDRKDFRGVIGKIQQIRGVLRTISFLVETIPR